VSFTTNFQGAGIGKKQRDAVVAALTTVLAGKPGKWHVQFIRNRDEMEMRVSGPGVETSEYLDAALDPDIVTVAMATIMRSRP
jgi:hypothetical protein